MDSTGRHEASGDSAWACRRKTLPSPAAKRSIRSGLRHPTSDTSRGSPRKNGGLKATRSNCFPWTGSNKSPRTMLTVSSRPLIITFARAQRTATGLMSTPMTRYPILPAKIATTPEPVPMSRARGRASSSTSAPLTGWLATARARNRPVRNTTGSWTSGKTRIGTPSTWCSLVRRSR